MKTKIKYILVFLFLVITLGLSIRGLPGNPKEEDLLQHKWREDGPFELSPERGRFALTYSLAETGSVYFPVNIARFVIPDLGYKDGHYVSLFAPLLSFVTLPGYLIGRVFGASQIGTFSVISIFGIINFFLIFKIAKKLGSNTYASLLGGIIFLFATPGFTYAINLYQHQVTTFLILLSFLIFISWKSIMSGFLIFFLYALGLPLDYPNVFLLFPIAIATGIRIFGIVRNRKGIKVNLNLAYALSLFGIVIPLIFFLWFNKASYGNPLNTLGSTAISSVKDIDTKGNPMKPKDEITIDSLQQQTEEEGFEGISYFDTRNIVNGLYLHIFSPDRGILIFAPIILFGILGAFAYKKSNGQNTLTVLVGVIVANIVLYSMWGDAWGGWAFGSRYLIPSYAILAILLTFSLTKYSNKILFIIPFYIILSYSIFVNTLGALTTSAMPPQVEAGELGQLSGKLERYSWDRNWEFINSGRSKSFIFQAFAKKYISSVQYFYIIYGSIILLSSSLISLLFFQKNEKEKNII